MRTHSPDLASPHAAEKLRSYQAVLQLPGYVTGLLGIAVPVADCAYIYGWAYARPPPSEAYLPGPDDLSGHFAGRKPLRPLPAANTPFWAIVGPRLPSHNHNILNK